MASDASFAEYVCDQAGLGARVTAKKMFGEYAPLWRRALLATADALPLPRPKVARRKGAR